jgi:uncharacterized membrane protein
VKARKRPIHADGFFKFRRYTGTRMILLAYILFFVLYSFCGWIIDTGFRSITSGKYDSGSFFPVPLCPIYGFGALTVLFLHSFFALLPIVIQFFLYSVILAFLEWGTGVFLKKVFQKRLWNYKSTPFNIATFTDLPHALAWGALALAFLYLVHPVVADTVYSILW